MGDSKTAIWCIHKELKHYPNENPQLTLSKKRLQGQLVELIINNKHLLYSKWFSGSANVIPAILSRDLNIDDRKILNLLTHPLPNQLHPYFRLSQVPRAIDSFFCSVLQSLPKPTQTWKKPNPSGFALGINGASS